MSRIISYLNLAYRFNVHMLKKPVSSARGAARERFLQSYSGDRLAPLTRRQRRDLPGFSGCICCGLCDTVCANLSASRRHLFNGPSDLASSVTRSMPDFDLADLYLAQWKECGDCKECEDICPAGVPLRKLAAFVDAVRKTTSETSAHEVPDKDPDVQR